MLEVRKWVLGPVATNTYLVGNPETREAAVVDPAWDGNRLGREIKADGWDVRSIWLTHAHFDHFAGLADLLEELDLEGQEGFFVGLHPKDHTLWKVKGGAVMFGVQVKSSPKPGHTFQDGESLELGGTSFQVLHAPGHSPGHVMFHCAEEEILFSGDVIFKQGIGRTDLLGGSYQVLMDSIRNLVLPLPDQTRIYSGHGPDTTVGEEKAGNPFL